MKIIYLLLFSIVLSACDVPVPLENLMETGRKLLGAAFQAKNSPAPTATPAISLEAATLKANTELLAEVFQVTFNNKEIEDLAQFSSLVSSLNQGASLEGIYHGLVMGARYRVLESKAKAASPNAIKFFAIEMGELQSGMKNPTSFNKETAKKYPTIEYPEGTDGASPDSYTFGESKDAAKDENQEPTKKNKDQLAEEFLQNFIGATPFTLKRVLSDEVLRKMDELKDNREDLAQWYAALVVRLSEAKTDFGLPQRNSSDYDFHSRFAKTMSLDRVKWEVLNRYHRIINRLE